MRDINSLLLPFDRSSRPKRQNIKYLNNITNKHYLVDIYGALYPIIEEHTFFSSTHETKKLITYWNIERVKMNSKNQFHRDYFSGTKRIK